MDGPFKVLSFAVLSLEQIRTRLEVLLFKVFRLVFESTQLICCLFEPLSASAEKAVFN